MKLTAAISAIAGLIVGNFLYHYVLTTNDNAMTDAIRASWFNATGVVAAYFASKFND